MPDNLVVRDAHGLHAYYHDCVMFEEDRIDKHGEPVNYVYAKLKADRVIYAEKYKRSLLYVKIHELEVQKAQGAIQCINPFTKKKCDDYVTYWTRVRDNHAKHYVSWMKYAAYFKAKAEEH